jgi:hypothetical protein
MAKFFTSHPIAFYDDAAYTPPTGARIITDAAYRALFDAQTAGKEIYVTTDDTLAARDRAVPAISIEQALAALATYRYNQQILGIYFQPQAASAPILFPTDDSSRNNVIGLVLAAVVGALTDTNPYKVAGSVVNLTKLDIQQLGIKMISYVSACFQRESDLVPVVTANVNADITTGWPSQL